jgi:putative transposase
VSDKFIERFAQGARPLDKLREVPCSQRQSLAPLLHHYAQTYSSRREAMARAFGTGVYTMQEIEDHFGVHYLTVSCAVQWFEADEQEIRGGPYMGFSDGFR